MIKDGTITLTNGSNTITGTGTKFLTRAVKSGWILRPTTIGTYLHVLVDASSEASLPMLETWQGSTESNLSYEILNEFLDYDIPNLSPNMSETAYAINYGHQKIIDALNSLGAASDEYQIITKKSIGVPVQGSYFGYQKFTGSVQIDKLVLSNQENETVESNLVFDIEINGVLQGLNITVPAGQSTVTSAALSNIVQAGQVFKPKWITVNGFASSNWDLDIYYHNTSGLRIYYDFQKMYFGTLYDGLILGSNYKPPSRGKVFGVTLELGEAAQGQAVILELLKDGASYSPAVTVTLDANKLENYLELSQKEFLTTEKCSLRVNQKGSIIPGSNLRATIHSYHTTA